MAAKEAPGSLVHEDDRCIAFKDINPQAPVHALVVPKKHLGNLLDAGPEDLDLLGHLNLVAAKVAGDLGIAQTGFRLVVNCNQDGGQSVDHLHLHVLGGRAMKWPPG